MRIPLFARLLGLSLALGLLGPQAILAATETNAEPVLLTVKGPHPLSFTASQLRQLPQKEIKTETPWTEGVHVFRGVLLRDVLQLAGIQTKTLTAKALNDYSAPIDTEDAYSYDVLLATLQDGKPMSRRNKGPIWVIYPLSQHAELNQTVYHRKMVWQVKELEPGEE